MTNPTTPQGEPISLPEPAYGFYRFAKPEDIEFSEWIPASVSFIRNRLNQNSELRATHDIRYGKIYEAKWVYDADAISVAIVADRAHRAASPAPTFPLHDDLHPEIGGWRESTYAGRVQLLHFAYDALVCMKTAASPDVAKMVAAVRRAAGDLGDMRMMAARDRANSDDVSEAQQAFDIELAALGAAATQARAAVGAVSQLPDAFWEALQRLIENAVTQGPASMEDARLVGRYRDSLAALSAQTPVVGSIPKESKITPEPDRFRNPEAFDCEGNLLRSMSFGAPPDGWREAIAEVRSGLDDATPSAFDNIGYRDYARTVLDAVEDELSSLYAQTPGEGWISVEDRLPEEGMPVLVTKDGGVESLEIDVMEEGCWRDWLEYVEHVEIIGGHTSDVKLYTHWAAIPKPPATPGEAA